MVFLNQKDLTDKSQTLREEGAESDGSLTKIAELPKDERWFGFSIL
jgi:hypothetical protein